MLNSLDLGFVQRLLEGCYHQNGAGRPPRNPLGLFKAHLTKRFLRISSLRELERRLWIDERLRAICGIAREEPAYGRTVLSRFNQRLGARRLKRVVDKQVKKLIRRSIVKARTVALDATFIKAHSRRSMDNRTGFSDPESRVRRAYRTYGLGYKLHMAVDTASGAPLSFLVAPANTNEKKLSIPLLKTTAKITEESIRQLAADSQYSSNSLREIAERYGIETAIPYPTNQKPDKRNVLRVTSDFKTHGPQRLKRIYRKPLNHRTRVRMAQGAPESEQSQGERTGTSHNPHLLLPTMPPLHHRSLTQHKPTTQVTKHNLLGELT